MLKAGFARLDITPPLGEDLAGYYHRRSADGVLDPLYVNALALESAQTRTLMIAIDAICIDTDRCDLVRSMIAERTGVPADYIYVATLHQHTAPWYIVGEARGATFRDKIFDDVVNRKLCDVAQMALDDLCEATVSVAEREVAEHIGFVRRYYTADGIIKTNPNTDKYTLTGRCAEADNVMRLVRFHREGANDVALVNFSTHPDVIGGNKWSADWPGFTRKFVEADLDGVSCIFFTGCQGDSNHIDYFKPKEQRLKGSTTAKSYEHSRFMGRTVADAVLAVWNETRAVSADTIVAQTRTVYNKTNLEGIEYYDEAVAWDTEYRRLEAEGNRQNIPHPYIQDVAHARRLISLRTAPIFKAIPMMLLSLGDVVFVGFGGEPFTSYGQIVRDTMPDKHVICTVCTGGYGGYFPTAEAFAQGGYEVISSILTPTVEQELIDTVKDMASHI